MRGPHERLAIAKDKVRLAENAVQFGVAPGLDKNIDVWGDHVVGAPLDDHRLNAVHGAVQRHAVEWNAEYVDGPPFFRGARGGLGTVLHLGTDSVWR
jgi:hypothetical protein